MEHPLEIINKSDSELFKKINENRELAFKEGSISLKHKYLIAMAIDTAVGAEGGVRSLVQQALKNGATKEEIMETLRIVNYICGAGSMYTAAAGLKDIL